MFKLVKTRCCGIVAWEPYRGVGINADGITFASDGRHGREGAASERYLFAALLMFAAAAVAALRYAITAERKPLGAVARPFAFID